MGFEHRYWSAVNVEELNYRQLTKNLSGSSLAVYTPAKQITACELTSNGKHVVLALKNSSKLITLELKGGDYTNRAENTNLTYGNKENESKVFNLND